MELAGYSFALLMGLTLGLIGGGGSVLTVPILYYFFRQDALAATTSSLFVVGATAFVGAILNSKKGLVDYKTGVIFAIPSFVGVFFSRKLILPSIPNMIFISESVIISKTLVVLVAFATLMIFASRAMIKSALSVKSVSVDNGHQIGPIKIATRGFLVGCATGFVGAGGGFLIIPALVLMLKVPMRVAVGTSLAIIAANSLFGFFISLNGNTVDWSVLLTIAVLGVVGLLLGVRFSGRVPEAKLKKGFGIFVAVVGFFILAEQIYKIIFV